MCRKIQFIWFRGNGDSWRTLYEFTSIIFSFFTFSNFDCWFRVLVFLEDQYIEIEIDSLALRSWRSDIRKIVTRRWFIFNCIRWVRCFFFFWNGCWIIRISLLDSTMKSFIVCSMVFFIRYLYFLMWNVWCKLLSLIVKFYVLL